MHQVYSFSLYHYLILFSVTKHVRSVSECLAFILMHRKMTIRLKAECVEINGVQIAIENKWNQLVHTESKERGFPLH